MDLSRKLGVIRYPKKWIDKYPIEVMNALHEFIVLDARYHWTSDSVEATGIHPMFEEVWAGCEPPRYDFNYIIQLDDRGKIVDVIFELLPNPR